MTNVNLSRFSIVFRFPGNLLKINNCDTTKKTIRHFLLVRYKNKTEQKKNTLFNFLDQNNFK